MLTKLTQIVLMLAFLASQAGPAHAEKPKVISAAQWEEVRALPGVPSSADMKNPQLFIFFDPNCPACTALFEGKKGQSSGEPSQRSKSYDDSYAAALQAVWIPVSYMNASSSGMAASILRSGRFASVIANYQGFDSAKRQGAAPVVTPTAAEQQWMARSNQVWSKLGGATPMWVYRDNQGQYQLFLGTPPEAQFRQIVASIATSKLEPYSGGQK